MITNQDEHTLYYKSSEWRNLRFRCLKRDHFKCQVATCDVSGSWRVSPHHIKPRREGGPDTLGNLITLCHKHHDMIEMQTDTYCTPTLIKNFDDVLDPQADKPYKQRISVEVKRVIKRISLKPRIPEPEVPLNPKKQQAQQQASSKSKKEQAAQEAPDRADWYGVRPPRVENEQGEDFYKPHHYTRHRSITYRYGKPVTYCNGVDKPSEYTGTFPGGTDPIPVLRRLVDEAGSQYAAALELGNPSWRGQINRLLRHDPTFSGASKEFLEALWKKAQVSSIVVEAAPGSVIFGERGLLQVGKVVAILVLPPEEWKEHSVTCAVCGAQTPRWSSATRYCRKHSYSTKDGRAYWRRERIKKA